MRHDRVFLTRAGWEAMLDAAPTLRRNPEVTRWAVAGWPLVRRRRLPGETAEAVPLGMPLPPGSGQRRIAVMASALAVSSIRPALSLAEARMAAPPVWQSTVEDCLQAAARHGQRIHVFGSLAWEAITGHAYLTSDSDLDLMLPIVPPAEPSGFLNMLDTITHRAPMCIDGELVRPDGAAMQWREVHSREALVKHEAGVTLMTPAAFLAGSAP